jgi:hypothetical protein
MRKTKRQEEEESRILMKNLMTSKSNNCPAIELLPFPPLLLITW